MSKKSVEKEYQAYLQYDNHSDDEGIGIIDAVEKLLKEAAGDCEDAGSGFGFRDQQRYFNDKKSADFAADRLKVALRSYGFKLSKNGTHVSVKAINKRCVEA